MTQDPRSRARFLVGIDLGTTHTVVAYAEREDPHAPIRLFEVAQLVAPGEVTGRPLLPSLRYHPAPGELAPEDVRLPWATGEPPEGEPPAIVGELARELGAKVPGRLVASAKSWLSHPAVDRTAPILPWGAAEGVPRISPVAASAGYLAHVRAAWNHAFPDDVLEAQELVLTVPASFDDAARTLTVDAARAAGLARVRLLEEPQAALYDWLHRSGPRLEASLGETRLLLVCDVGGGTTDLSLVGVSRGAAGSGPKLERIGVGDHLMLGGDNMDLALAHLAESRMGGPESLGAARFSQLVQQCRAAKERFLGPEPPERAAVTVLGAGARLVGGARSAELTRSDVEALVLEGFFPAAALDERPRKSRSGLVEFGLPYASDPAVTRHLAAFLAAHAHASRTVLGEAGSSSATPVPEAVLLNGGVFRSPVLAHRVLDVLAAWRGAPVLRLVECEPDLAVARGAVAYGLALRGRGLRIAGGSARAYYLLVEAEGRERAVCVLPQGAEEGSEARLSGRSFALRLGQPVRFLLVSTTGDAPHRPGDVVEWDPETMAPLPPLATILTAEGGGAHAAEERVELAAGLTEVGTLEVSCVAAADAGRRWRLEFDLRAGREAAPRTVLGPSHPRAEAALARIERAYGSRSPGVDPREVRGLRSDLEALLGKREGWDAPLLRELYGALWEHVRRRRRTADHERAWLNLAGYCLRPGSGYPLDEWRVGELWRIYGEGVQHAGELQVWSEWWTLWRRVAGGLPASAQEAILEDISYHLKPPARRGKRPAGPKRHGEEDMVRLAGALERLSAAKKAEVGSWLLEGLGRAGAARGAWWSLGRLGARVPLFGSAHEVVAREVAAEWVRRALAADWRAAPDAALAAALLARLSGDRDRDLPADLRPTVAGRLRSAKAPASWARMVESVIELEAADEQKILGDTLPPGLKLAP